MSAAGAWRQLGSLAEGMPKAQESHGSAAGLVGWLSACDQLANDGSNLFWRAFLYKVPAPFDFGMGQTLGPGYTILKNLVAALGDRIIVREGAEKRLLKGFKELPS